MSGFFISPEELSELVGTPKAPIIVDVRRRSAYEADLRILPTAKWRDHREVETWCPTGTSGHGMVVYCQHGHAVSQSAGARLRARGVAARVLAGGIEGWRAAGGLILAKAGWPDRNDIRASRWVTRAEPKIDRIACPWFLRRFVDRQAEILFVEAGEVQSVAEETGAIPFDIEGAEFTHRGELCSFDTFLDRFEVGDSVLRDLATIVRGADTSRLDLAAEAAGLLALSLGISAMAESDEATLEAGFALYDALYAWRRRAAGEKHGWPPARSAA